MDAPRSPSRRPLAARRPGIRPRRRSPWRDVRARPRPGGPSRAASLRDLDVLDLDDRDLDPPWRGGSSMIACRIALIFSRSDSSSSSLCWPSTDRSVVCAICDVATMKFSTWTIASFGSTIRKYATAFTRTGTLSLVITSCGGTLSVIVRRSTLTIPIDERDQQEERPGPLGVGEEAPEAKDDAALVLPRDLEGADQRTRSRRKRRRRRPAIRREVMARS